MPALGISETAWTHLLIHAVATTWLFPGMEHIEGIQEAVSLIEQENPELIIRILNIVERKYQGLDNETMDHVEYLREMVHLAE